MSKNEKGKKVLENTLQKRVSDHYAAVRRKNEFRFVTINFWVKIIPFFSVDKLRHNVNRKGGKRWIGISLRVL